MYGLVTHFVPFKTSGIYAIINTVNGKVYIGSSVDIKKRMGIHASDMRLNRHHNLHLASAVKKYGVDKFECVVVELCPINKLIDKENEWIQRMNATDNNLGYNKRHDASSNAGIRLSEARKKQIGEWSREYQNRPDVKARRIAACHARNSGNVFAEWSKINGHPSTKEYAFISPSGMVHLGRDIKKFSKDNGLSYQSMGAIMRGSTKCHRGWRKASSEVKKSPCTSPNP